ncbi:uncharacterized protein [Aristolochia californica]|uniref:uncharacterized protein isoform X4 n=1 Tax=Aristolochia californica TaxID=171875 RepID=UPI0035D97265
MGSSGSKEAGASSPDGVRGTRLRGARVFHSSCLGGSSASTSDDDSVLGSDDKESGRSKTQTFMNQSRITTGGRKNNCCGKFRVLQTNQGPSNHSNTELDECGRPSVRNAESGAESSSMQTALARASSREDRDLSDSRQGNGRVLRDHARRGESSDGHIDTLSSSTYHVPATSRSTNSSQDNEVDTPNMREARDRALVEHRTAFLERRRRIRSQVRALQQLGSRFENLSGHNSSCILSGQHRSGRCTCRAGGHAPNPEEDMNTRASISRIVMLAEALFEVLDEIHQQSVVLSSRPSESSIGSVPAPKEIVESMPVKVYTKPQKHQIEEAAQDVCRSGP